jgi:membrane fusion protein (multidrug efflux system)
MSTNAKTNERKLPNRIGTVVLIVLAIGGILVGAYWLNDTIHYVSTDDAAIDGNHVMVSARMLGRIRDIVVNEGQKVTQGQLLIQLEDSDLRAQELQANASLNYAKENLNLDKVNLDKAQDDYQRAKNLYDSGVSTKEQYTHTVKAMETAKAQYTMAQAQIDTANAQLGVIESQLQNTRITAPIAGVIAKKSYDRGDVVQPGQAIFSLNDLSDVWVIANFEETKIRNIRPGAPVYISVDAYPGHDLKGRVVLISAGIVTPPFAIGDFTKTTQRVPIKILLDEKPDNFILLPGMSVEVKVKIN